MGYTWARNNGASTTINGKANFNVGAAAVGGTIRRTLFGWSASVIVPAWMYEPLVGEPVFAGAVTMRSGFSGTLHSPAENPLLEPLYPGERWLYYEFSPLLPDGAPRPRHIFEPVTLHTHGTWAARECLTAVLNTFAAQTLNVWVSLDCPGVVPLGVELNALAYGSVLYTS